MQHRKRSNFEGREGKARAGRARALQIITERPAAATPGQIRALLMASMAHDPVLREKYKRYVENHQAQLGTYDNDFRAFRRGEGRGGNG